MALSGRMGLLLLVVAACEAPPARVVPARELPSTVVEGRLDHPPAIDAPVTDLAGLLSADEASELDARVRRVRDETGVQIALLTVPALPKGMPIEDFSLQVAEQWSGGTTRDDGLLVTLAWGERRSRIEVGYGLEGYVTDAEAGQLLVDAAPYLRANDTAGALGLVVDGLHGEVASLTPGEPPPAWRRVYGAGVRLWPPRALTSLLGLLAGAAFAPWLAWTRSRRGFPGHWRHLARQHRLRLWLGWLAVFGGGSGLLALFGEPWTATAFLVSGAVGSVVQAPLGFADSPENLRFGLWTAAFMGVLGVGMYLSIVMWGEGLPPEFAWILYGTLGLGMTSGASMGGGGGGGGGSYGSSSSSSGGSSAGSSSSGGGWSGGGGGFGGGGASGSW